MRRLTLRFLLCLVSSIGLNSGVSLSAQESYTGSWEITVENDKWGSNTDQHYTHGTRLTRRSNDVPNWLRRTADWFPCIACSDPSSVEYEFGQEIFTPENTASIELIEDDRPYAGWAYAKTTLSSVRSTANANKELFDAIGFQIGVVGPASLAERTQRLIHKGKGVSMPQGWDNQLGQEIGVVLTYTRGMRRRFGQVSGGAAGHDLALYVVGALGNVFTHLGAGARWRFGVGLANERASRRRGWHVFTEIETRAVARNIFLDGNTRSDSHSVRKRPLVGHLAAGLEYEGTRFGLRITKVVRSKEFYGQVQPDEYGSITFFFRP